MERQTYWAAFIMLGVLGLWGLPFLWALTLIVPVGVFCWWITYRTDLH